MTTSIRSFCLAALLAARSAWAQQQPADNPDNPHSTQAKDKQGSDVSTSTTNQQVDQAEQPDPNSPQNKDRDRVGSAGMDHDAMMQNATPQTSGGGTGCRSARIRRAEVRGIRGGGYPGGGAAMAEPPSRGRRPHQEGVPASSPIPRLDS